MECKGLESYAFHPMTDEFIFTSEGGCLFDENVELGEGDCYDYDGNNAVPVSLEDISFKFESV
jgi:hypothetical protein